VITKKQVEKLLKDNNVQTQWLKVNLYIWAADQRIPSMISIFNQYACPHANEALEEAKKVLTDNNIKFNTSPHSLEIIRKQ
jgi:hypothetical protein